jgi:hypothetical protein
MSVFIREKSGKYYLVNRYYEGSKRKERWTPLDGEDLSNLLKALKIKEVIARQTVEVPCMNPFCSNKLKMTPQQKQDLLISFKKKYDKLVLVCCSKECQHKVLSILQQN